MTAKASNISVVIPVKDRKRVLAFAVSSVRRQSLPPRELIIVDDGSTVPVAAEDFADLAPMRLTVLRNERNLGAARSCNRGLAAASSPVVAFLDSDDCFDERYIKTIDAAWRRSAADTVCVAAGFWWCTDELAPYRAQVVRGPPRLRDLLRRGNFVGGNSVLSVKRQAALEAGGFPPLRGSYDFGLLIRLARSGAVRTIASPLVYYRSPSATSLDNETMNHRRQVLSMFAIMREQPRRDRPQMRRMLHHRVCLALILLGRRARGGRMLLAYLRRYGPDRNILMAAFALVFGPRGFSRAIGRWARLRAALGRLFSPRRAVAA